MPAPTYKSAIGFAKDAANSTLTAAVAAAAVVVPVAGTNIPALSTITIIDGPLTETRAVTAGGGTTSLTVAALTNPHPANTYVVSQLTASVGAADWMPVTVLDVEDDIDQLDDEGLRGSAVVAYGNADGVRSAMLTIGGPVFLDVVPYLIAGVTGSSDFTGGSPNTFAFATKNTGDTQPTPLLIWVNNGVDTRIYTGAKVEEVDFAYDTGGLLTFTAKVRCWMSGPYAALLPTYSTLVPPAAWQVQATIGGVAVQYVPSATIKLSRPASVISTLQGIQDPYRIFLGPQMAEGSFVAVMEDNTQLSNYLLNSQPSLDFTFTSGTGATQVSLGVRMTKANFLKPKINQTGTSYLTIALPFKAIANTTDATVSGTGYSPVKVTVKNAKATGTYL